MNTDITAKIHTFILCYVSFFWSSGQQCKQRWLFDVEVRQCGASSLSLRYPLDDAHYHQQISIQLSGDHSRMVHHLHYCTCCTSPSNQILELLHLDTWTSKCVCVALGCVGLLLLNCASVCGREFLLLVRAECLCPSALEDLLQKCLMLMAFSFSPFLCVRM